MSFFTFTVICLLSLQLYSHQFNVCKNYFKNFDTINFCESFCATFVRPADNKITKIYLPIIIYSNRRYVSIKSIALVGIFRFIISLKLKARTAATVLMSRFYSDIFMRQTERYMIRFYDLTGLRYTNVTNYVISIFKCKKKNANRRNKIKAKITRENYKMKIN